MNRRNGALQGILGHDVLVKHTETQFLTTHHYQPQNQAPQQPAAPQQAAAPQPGNKHKVKTWDEIPTVGKLFLGILIALTFPISLPIFLGVRYAQKKAA